MPVTMMSTSAANFATVKMFWTLETNFTLRQFTSASSTVIVCYQAA